MTGSTGSDITRCGVKGGSTRLAVRLRARGVSAELISLYEQGIVSNLEITYLTTIWPAVKKSRTAAAFQHPLRPLLLLSVNAPLVITVNMARPPMPMSALMDCHHLIPMTASHNHDHHHKYL